MKIYFKLFIFVGFTTYIIFILINNKSVSIVFTEFFNCFIEF